MDRKALETRAANYPYLQGVWPIGTGLLWILIGASNLGRTLEGMWLTVVGVGLIGLAVGGERAISKHYRETYGEVVPTQERNRRYLVASAGWTVVCLVGLFLPTGDSCLLATTFAAATLIFYALLTGIRTHHWAVWTPVLVAGLLPIWAGVGDPRNPKAMIVLGALLILTGLLDQWSLRRDFASVTISDSEYTGDPESSEIQP